MPQNNCQHKLNIPGEGEKVYKDRNAFMDDLLKMNPEDVLSKLKSKQHAVQIESPTAEVLRPEVPGEGQGMGLQQVGEGDKERQVAPEVRKEKEEITRPQQVIGTHVSIDHNNMEVNGRISDVNPDGSVQVEVTNPDGYKTSVKVDEPQLKNVSDAIRGYLKDVKDNPSDKMFETTLGLPVSVYDHSINLMVNAIDRGLGMDNAASRAIEFINENWSKDWDKQGFFDMLKESAREDGLDFNEDKIKGIITGDTLNTNEPNFDVPKEEKRPLTDEEVSSIKAGIDKRIKTISDNQKEKQRYKIDLKVAMNRMNDMYKSFLSTFTAIRNKDARKVATIFNAEMGKFRVMILEHHDKIEAAKNDLMKISKADRLKFIAYIQNGVPQENKALQDHANLLSAMLDKTADELSKIKDLNILDNYFPQFWKKEKVYNDAQGRFSQAIHELYGKKKIEGPASFYKKRILSDILDGYEKGFELITDNPAELVQLYNHSASQYRMGYNFMNELVKNNLALPTADGVTDIRTGKKLPDNFVKGDYSLFNSFAKQFYAERPAKPGEEVGKNILIREGLYVDPHVNELLNTIYGRGVTGDLKTILNRFGNIGNALNFMQLGASLFHATTTLGNFAASNMALGWTNLTAGRPIEASKFFAEGIMSPALIFKAYNLTKELKNAAFNGEENPTLQMVQDAGGRLMADPIYTLRIKDQLKQTYYDLKNKDIGAFYGIPKGIWQSLLTAQTATTEVIMNHFVPMMKLLAFNQLAQNELELRRPNSEMERQQIIQQAWTHIDNRFGQMVYDRLFMNKLVKEGAFLGFRAFGWTIGNIKELGGGVTTGLAKSAERVVKGKGLNPDTAFTLGLLTANGVTCATINYLLWSHSREMNAKDLLAVDSGKKNKDGTSIYFSPFAYTKEINSYTHDMWTLASKGDYGSALKQFASNSKNTIGNKVNPGFTFISQLLNNRDYFGNPILHHPNALLSDDEKKSFVKRMMDSDAGDAIRYAADQFTPISFKSDVGKDESMNTIAYWQDQFKSDNILPKLGITVSPKTFDRETWENLVMDKYISTLDKNKAFDQNTVQARNQIQMGIENEKNDQDKAAVMALISHLRSQGIIKPTQGYAYFKRLNQDYYSNLFSHLDPEEQVKLISLNVIPEDKLNQFLVHGLYHKSYNVKNSIILWARKNKDLVNSSDMYKHVIQELDPYWQ